MTTTFDRPVRPTHRTAIREAFKTLRRQGYFARMNFKCCSSCGWYAVPEEKAEKVVFYNQQSASAFTTDGWRRERTDTLHHDLYLQWAGDGNEIVAALREQGLTVEWNGSESQTVMVKTDPVQIENVNYDPVATHVRVKVTVEKVIEVPTADIEEAERIATEQVKAENPDAQVEVTWTRHLYEAA